jgi:hypothetical protein
MEDHAHRYTTDGQEFWCKDCGHEPWHRPVTNVEPWCKDNGHRYTTDGQEVWCKDCGHEPWHRPVRLES